MSEITMQSVNAQFEQAFRVQPAATKVPAGLAQGVSKHNLRNEVLEELKEGRQYLKTLQRNQ